MSDRPDPASVPQDPQRMLFSGRAVAGFVLALVGLVPCFWIVQIPGALGIVLGAIGLRDTNGGARRGRGMALAGVIVGATLILFAVVFVLVLATNDDCSWENGRFNCQFD
jgi:hypothetical protein